MNAHYHRLMTSEALRGRVEQTALRVMIKANLGQDGPGGLIGHPEFHFDDSAFEAGSIYLARQNGVILESLQDKDAISAWKAFGRLSHAVQDFYSHSNYVRLWIQNHPGTPTEKIDPLEPGIIDHPDLRSGRVYSPWEVFTFTPIFGRFFRYLLPRDAHAWMNLDSPKSGPLFDYARIAAQKRTTVEFDRVVHQIHQMEGESLSKLFTGPGED